MGWVGECVGGETTGLWRDGWRSRIYDGVGQKNACPQGLASLVLGR